MRLWRAPWTPGLVRNPGIARLQPLACKERWPLPFRPRISRHRVHFFLNVTFIAVFPVLGLKKECVHCRKIRKCGKSPKE